MFVRGQDEELRQTLRNPITGEVGSLTCYESGATFDSTFGKVSSGYEEARAESVGIFLSTERTVLETFGYTDPTEQDDMSYLNWLMMCRAGLTALEFYTPETKSWRQAHMNARYTILRVLLEAGEGLVEIAYRDNADGNPDIEVRLDRSKVRTVGMDAMRRFLLKLQVYRSTANATQGAELFQLYSAVDEQMLAFRTVVMARKLPRKLVLQPNMILQKENPVSATGGHQSTSGLTILLQEYAETSTGVIESYVDRYRHVNLAHLMDAYRKDVAFVDDLYRT